jgi:hypothetical protein
MVPRPSEISSSPVTATEFPPDFLVEQGQEEDQGVVGESGGEGHHAAEAEAEPGEDADVQECVLLRRQAGTFAGGLSYLLAKRCSCPAHHPQCCICAVRRHNAGSVTASGCLQLPLRRRPLRWCQLG